MRALSAVLVALLASCQRSAPAGGTPDLHGVQVILDQSLQQVTSPFDTSFEGMSMFTALLRKHGARVSVSNASLDSIPKQIHGPGNVLVLGIPWAREYSTRALEAIDRYRDSGAGLLVISEHDDMYGNATIQNRLTERSGIRTLVGSARSRQAGAHAKAIWPDCSAPLFTVQNVRAFLPAPLALTPPAQPLLLIKEPASPEASVVAAISEERPGRMVVLADLEMLWNMAPATGLRAGDNTAFTLRLVDHLANGRSTRSSDPTREQLGDERGRASKIAWFPRDGAGLVPDGAHNGVNRLASFLAEQGYAVRVGDLAAGVSADVAFAIAPLEPFARPDELLRARRLVLVGDGRTDLLAAEPHLARLGHVASNPYPLQAVVMARGAEFLPATLVDATTQSYSVQARWIETQTPIQLYRAAALRLDAIGTHGWTILATADPDTVATTNLTPSRLETASSTRVGGRPLYRREEHATTAQAWPVVARTQTTMVVADLELITDSGLEGAGGERFLSHLRAWLAED